MKLLRWSLVIASLFGSTVSASEVAEVNPRRHAGGFARLENNRIFEPSKSPLPLPRKDLSWSDRSVGSKAERIIDTNKTTAILLVEKGQIVFEKYKEPATDKSAMYSQSMSKSLTAYTLGNMLCNGGISSLNDPASKYLPELAGTASGDAPLRHVLSMSSGVADAKMAGQHEDNQTEKVLKKEYSTLDVVKKFGAKTIESGKELRYTASDTFTLSLVGDATGGFFDSFEKYLWKPAATESKGFWLYDKNGNPMSASGFSATIRDWARLAIFSVKQLKSDGCIGDYMKAATSAQVPNKSKRIGAAFKSYGYQTWIADFGGVSSYWWVGYGGQRVGIDPASEKIIVLTSYREDYMEDVYKLFREWTR